MGPERIDVVYTWVDDRWPGYLDVLRAHAQDAHDLNPNRTRDNLELLRFSLRSIARFMPWIGRVHLVTMRPQVPAWLNAETVRVVHHDQLFSPQHLPSFNSFAILSHLVDIPGLSQSFLYLEDDRLFLAPVTPETFVTAAGKLRLYLDGARTPGASERARRGLSPWERALAEANHRLDARYGQRVRPSIKQAPLWIEQAQFRRYRERFAQAIARTRESRFRGRGDVASEHMYPWSLWHEGLAELVPPRAAHNSIGYVGLERYALYNRLALARLAWRKPPLVCLNDNFGARPGSRAVAVVQRFLARQFPTPSRFERQLDRTPEKSASHLHPQALG